LPTHAPGLFHAGSVGIIMSGWLGTINYGVITANKIDSFLRGNQSTEAGDSTDSSFAVA
jgi:all-trans-retinol 13,14-reductase